MGIRKIKIENAPVYEHDFLYRLDDEPHNKFTNMSKEEKAEAIVEFGEKKKDRYNDILDKIEENKKKYIPSFEDDKTEVDEKEAAALKRLSEDKELIKKSYQVYKDLLREESDKIIQEAKNKVNKIQETIENFSTNEEDINKPSLLESELQKLKENKKQTEEENTTTSTTVASPYYEMVNHPSHYNSSSIETIEKMRRIWGNESTALWCEMTAFKYRDRIGNKPDNSNDQEVGKIKWYENKAKELRSNL